MLTTVQERIMAACERAGRNASEVKLVAVSKGQEVATVEARLLSQGHYVLGENRAQELRDKRPLLPAEVEWHFVGNLQRNKIKYLEDVALIHSVNSVRLANALNSWGEREQREVAVLISVNVAQEASKHGVTVADLSDLVAHVRELPHLELRGLMTMAPYGDDPELARPHFRRLRELAQRYDLPELSMGMSGDFEVAIEEGATIVRIGTALFEEAQVQDQVVDRRT